MSSEISSIQNATERCLKWGPQWLFYRASFLLMKRYMLQLLGGRHINAANQTGLDRK